MRTMMKITIPVEGGNVGVKDGSLAKLVGDTLERLKPEAAYFWADHGVRTSLMVFDLKDAADIPSIAEPFFMGLNAAVDFAPVMNADDLKKGLSKIS